MQSIIVDPTLKAQDHFQYLKQLSESGFILIPCSPNSPKQPTIRDWANTDHQSWYQISSAFSPHYTKPVSLLIRGFKVLDFEGRGADLIKQINNSGWSSNAKQLVRRMPVIKTPSGGYHAYYRCDSDQSSQALSKNANGELLVELLATMKVSIPPTPNYKHVGGSLFDIPTISASLEANILFQLRQFNEWEKPAAPIDDEDIPDKTTYRTEYQDEYELGLDFNDYVLSLKVGDRFNLTQSWEFLTRAGWDELKKGHWRKPHSYKRQHQATTNETSFYCFSTSAPPFDADSCYSKFAAWTHLFFGGDFKLAARTTQDYFDLGWI